MDFVSELDDYYLWVEVEYFAPTFHSDGFYVVLAQHISHYSILSNLLRNERKRKKRFQ